MQVTVQDSIIRIAASKQIAALNPEQHQERASGCIKDQEAAHPGTEFRKEAVP